MVDEPSLLSSSSQLVCQTIHGFCSNEDVVGDLKGRVQAPGSVTDPENLNDVDPSRRHVLYDVM